MAESHIYSGLALTTVYGVLGLIMILAVAFPFGRGRRGKNRQTLIRENLESSEYARTQAFISLLLIEQKRLRLELDSLRNQLMDRQAEGEDPLRQAMLDLDLDPGKPLTQSDLKKSYVMAMKRHHPDHGGSSEALSRVQHAYSILKSAMSAA